MDNLPGLHDLLHSSTQFLHGDEVTDDVAAEIESMQAAAEFDDELERDPSYLQHQRASHPSLFESSPTKRQKVVYADLEKHIEKASEHVVVPGTLNEYRKYVHFTLLKSPPRSQPSTSS